MTTKDRWLLPEGVEETLPAEAHRLETMRRAAVDLFATRGYELVMPPLIEYLDSLLTGVGKDLDLQTFKLTDQLTGRMMGVRADMTPQAARIDAHYLKRKTPVRLCYVGPVLRTRPDQFAGTREPLQLGAELFGYAGPQADAEVLDLMIATLTLFGLEQIHVDLAHAGIFRTLVAQAQLTPDQEQELLDALQRKARSDAIQLLTEASVATPARTMLLALLDLCGGIEVLNRAQTVFRDAPAPVGQALQDLKLVAEIVARRQPAAELFFDLAELGGYHYYTGVLFSAFIPGQGQAIAKGGRYDGIGRAFGRDRCATGFGADLRQLAKVGSLPDRLPAGIFAPDGEDSALTQEITRLRASGERVIQRLPGDDSSATDLGCDRELTHKGGRWILRATE